MHNIEVLELEDGGLIGIEVDLPPKPGGDKLISSSGQAQRETAAFNTAISRIRPMADQLIGSMKNLVETPDQVEVKFGIKVSAQAGVVVAKAATDANFEVTLTWKSGQ